MAQPPRLKKAGSNYLNQLTVNLTDLINAIRALRNKEAQ